MYIVYNHTVQYTSTLQRYLAPDGSGHGGLVVMVPGERYRGYRVRDLWCNTQVLCVVGIYIGIHRYTVLPTSDPRAIMVAPTVPLLTPSSSVTSEHSRMMQEAKTPMSAMQDSSTAAVRSRDTGAAGGAGEWRWGWEGLVLDPPPSNTWDSSSPPGVRFVPPLGHQ